MNGAGFGIDFALQSRTGVPSVFAARTVFSGRVLSEQNFGLAEERMKNHNEARFFAPHRSTPAVSVGVCGGVYPVSQSPAYFAGLAADGEFFSPDLLVGLDIGHGPPV